MKTEIRALYQYGGWNDISFKKEINLNISPCIGWNLFETDGEHEINLQLKEKSNKFESVTIWIQYNIQDETLYIERREYWREPITSGALDSIIKNFTQLGWTRMDNTNLEDLKKLMHKNR